MDTRPCSFCSHKNPEDAKFCNACGASMHLQLCQHCGAIDNVSAVACYKCGRSFSSRGADDDARTEAERGTDARSTAAPASPGVAGLEKATTTPRPADPAPVRRPEQRKGSAARALLFVVIAAAAVFLYRAYLPSEEGGAADAVQARAPDRSSPGTIDATLGAVPPSSAILAAEVVPVRTPPAAPAVAQPPAADVPPLPQDEGQPAAVPEPSNAGGAAGSEVPPGSYPCTPGVAALGLCN